jgi:hypothetical protein
MSQMVTDLDYLPGNRLKLKILPCPVCKIRHEVVVGLYEYDKWADGIVSIEEAFPDLTPAERELLITGIDGECFAAMPTEDDEVKEE